MDQQALQAQSMMQQQFDGKKYICGPWIKGKRGGPWNQIFKPAFENALRAQKDNFNTMHDHMVTETALGAQHGPAHPAGAGLQAIAFQSTQAFNVRDELCLNLILLHIGYDQDIKDQIEAYRLQLFGQPTNASRQPNTMPF